MNDYNIYHDEELIRRLHAGEEGILGDEEIKITGYITELKFQ